MPPSLDIYVLTKSRDKKTITQFVDTYVDREASEERHDEELMMLPLTESGDSLQSATDLSSFDAFDWEPAHTLTNIIERGLKYPRRAFAVYLRPIDHTIEQAIICFTADNQLVIGLSIDDEGAQPENERRAQEILSQLMQQFTSHAGLLVVEDAPPISEKEFAAKASAPLTMHFVMSGEDDKGSA